MTTGSISLADEKVAFLGGVIASISHELKNALATVHETAGLLSDIVKALADPGEDAQDLLSGAESISDNHGHELVVPARDVAQGVERTYDITGTSSHPHTVILTASDFETLRQGGIVMVTSSSDASHSHEVTVSCAG